MARKKVYIAGKITGDPKYHEKFQKAQAELEREGFIVISPAILPEGMTPADCMRICIAMIDTADIVAFLPDWHQSKGALVEHSWCKYTEKPIVYLPLRVRWDDFMERKIGHGE